ncbi:hypothetical protein S31_1565 [Escherichia coli B86]|nr:hypothetical protein S31_1565 [Escherichia coli B86]
MVNGRLVGVSGTCQSFAYVLMITSHLLMRWVHKQTSGPLLCAKAE